MELEINGNETTHLMHFYTMHELHKMHILGSRKLKAIKPEQAVLIEKNGLREGRFDFLVHDAENKAIGIEILTRPSAGKMKKKLCYAKEVDEFVFVIPEGSLEGYLARKPAPFKVFCRPNLLPPEFGNGKIYVWIFDLKERKFTEKGKARDLFCIGRKKGRK